METSGGNATLPAPGSATTIPGCDTPFSRPSAFGLFLTLAFCLLTQPQGTLLYPPSSKPPGLTLALLRLYPANCLAETAIMTIYLTRSLWCAWREGHQPKWQVTSTNKWYQIRLSLNLGPFLSQIRMTAAALLSVRSGKQADILAVLRAQTESKETELPHHSTRPGQATATGAEPNPGTLPRRRTTTLEEGITLGTSEPESPRDETIMATVDPDVLAHGQLQVDVVTLVSVLTIMAKLAFSTLPGAIRFTAWPLVVGWIGLHAVLLIFHSGGDDGINSVDSAALIRELRMIEAELNRPTAHRGFMLLSVFINSPILFYLFELLDNSGPRPEGLVSAYLGEFWVVFIFIVFALMLAAPMFVLLFLLAQLTAILIRPYFEFSVWNRKVLRGIYLMLHVVTWGGVVVTFIWRSQADVWWTENLRGVSSRVISLLCACILPVVMDMWYLFGIYSWPFSFGDLVAKTFVMVVGFCLMVMLYHVEETCKPGWLDFLG